MMVTEIIMIELPILSKLRQCFKIQTRCFKGESFLLTSEVTTEWTVSAVAISLGDGPPKEYPNLILIKVHCRNVL